jgi:DNA replication and repair protein RecF
MRVEKTRLVNFRCFLLADLKLSEGLNVVIGPNASGKTSLLESVFVASAGRSPRAKRDAELVRWGESEALVEVHFRHQDSRSLQVRVGIELGDNGTRKLVSAADKPVRQVAELLSCLPVILFTPADLQLAQAEPVVRRRFMNLALARLLPAYADDLARFRRALVQRNRLLQAAATSQEIAPWTQQLIRYGAQVTCHRRGLAAALSQLGSELYAQLAGSAEHLSINYVGDLAQAPSVEEAATLYRTLLQQCVAEERRLGRTLFGPHRDDLSILINGQVLRRFGSQGQQRTAALALKLAEANLIRRQAGESPILLLDDCLSELDEQRATRLLRLTANYEQLIVTTASQVPVLDQLEVATWVHLEAGEVKRVERRWGT